MTGDVCTMPTRITKTDLHSWIEKAIESEKYIEREITVLGTTEKGDGYVGDVVFAKVNGTTQDNITKEINLVIKHGKCNDNLRKSVPVRAAFETEIHFYSKIIPAFKRLQEKHGIEDMFVAVPKCYDTVMLSNMEALIMENLKEKGFELYDRKTPLNMDHLKVVLGEYGKLHALSFALRDQEPEVFNKLCIRPNSGKDFLTDEAVRNSFNTAVAEAIEVLEENGEHLLSEKFRKLFHKDAGDILLDLTNEDITETVFTHGDCWNNNFMYKYEDNMQSPSKVMIIDWQISALRSPAFDLSYFIYATSSKEQLDKFQELMDVYYTSFSTFLRKLGSDPERLFSYSTFKSHWKKYKLYGLLYLPLLLKFILCDKKDAPELANIREGDSIATFTNINISEKELYYERLKSAVNHFFEFDF